MNTTTATVVITTEKKPNNTPPVTIHRMEAPGPFAGVTLIGVFPDEEPIKRFRIQINTPFGTAEFRGSLVSEDYSQPPVIHEQGGAYEFITGYGFALWHENSVLKVDAAFARTAKNILAMPGGQMYVPAFVAGTAFSYRNVAGPKSGNVTKSDEIELGRLTQNLSILEMLEMYRTQHGLSNETLEQLIATATKNV